MNNIYILHLITKCFICLSRFRVGRSCQKTGFRYFTGIFKSFTVVSSSTLIGKLLDKNRVVGIFMKNTGNFDWVIINYYIHFGVYKVRQYKVGQNQSAQAKNLRKNSWNRSHSCFNELFCIKKSGKLLLLLCSLIASI